MRWILSELSMVGTQRLVVVHLQNRVWFFATSWTTTCQTPLSFTISRSLLKFISIALVMLSCPLPTPFAFNLSHNSKFFFHWVRSSHEVTKILKLHHQPFQWLLSVDFLSSTTEHHFCFGLAVSFFLELLVIALYSFIRSILDIWSGGLIFKCHIVLPFHTVHGTAGRNTGVIYCLWTIFFQNTSLLPVCLGWPCTSWLITSLSYSSPFVTTKLWSMKETQWLKPLLSISSHHYYLQANSYSLIGVFNQHSITFCKELC